MKLVGSGTKTPTFVTSHLKGRTLDPLHATLQEVRSRRLYARRDQLPALPRSASENLVGLTLDGLARRLRYAKCGGSLLLVKPWRQTDASGRAWERRG